MKLIKNIICNSESSTFCNLIKIKFNYLIYKYANLIDPDRSIKNIDSRYSKGRIKFA